MERMAKRLTQRTEDAEAGAFIGFDSSNESDLSQDEVRIFFILILINFTFRYCFKLNIKKLKKQKIRSRKTVFCIKKNFWMDCQTGLIDYSKDRHTATT